MNTIQTNEKLRSVLADWDPFHIGVDNYEMEMVDVIGALYLIDDVTEFSLKIQAIYEHSFEKVIPLDMCEKVANQLLLIKNEISCER